MTKIHIKNKYSKWSKYTTRVILGLSIFFFRKFNNTMMKKFTILFTKNVLKKIPKKLDEKLLFFHPTILHEAI